MFNTLTNHSLRCRSRGVSRAVLDTTKRCLSLHEYQAQQILKDAGLRVPVGQPTKTVPEVASAIDSLGGKGVLKSQIHAGGRGKGAFANGLKSGVHVVSSKSTAEELAGQMFNQNLITKQTTSEGLPVHTIYVTERLNIAREFYLGMTISREDYSPILLMSAGGGTGIEEMAAKNPESIVKMPITYSKGVSEEVISTVCQKMGFGSSQREEVSNLLTKLYQVFKDSDATLLEINPLVEIKDTKELVCADTKLSVDNAAQKRQADIFQMRDFSQEKAIELEAEKNGLVYIQLEEGNIGCLVNGAGLAMATNDAVAHFGGKCANFLDGGGQATKETMIKAFELILSDPNVTTILVNIYGGIIRCDMIAESVIAAAKDVADVPVVVRLQGTNAEEGQRLIANSDLDVFAETDFDGAVRKAIEVAGKTKRQSSSTSSATRKPPSNASDQGSAIPGKPSFRAFSTSSPFRKPVKASSVNHRSARNFTSSARNFQPASYAGTISNLAINSETRVMYQGFTGRTASKNAQETIQHGTKIVGGVSPSLKTDKAMHPDPALSQLPVYRTVRQAMDEIKPDASAVFVPAQFAAAAIIEAIEAEVPLIVSVAEHIPVHDMLRVQEILRSQSKSRLVGPNCPGIISPLRSCKIGIMPYLQYAPGKIGIASKSGTLSYEAVGSTTKAGVGQSLCIGVGGDLLPGTSLLDAVTILTQDDATEGIVLLGEIGGQAEIEAAAFLKDYREKEIKAGRKPKPVVGMVTGRTAPKGRTMGHAGAIGGSVTAEDKIKAMEDAGIIIPVHPGEIGPMMRNLLEENGNL